MMSKTASTTVFILKTVINFPVDMQNNATYVYQYPKQATPLKKSFISLKIITAVIYFFLRIAIFLVCSISDFSLK